MEAMKKPKSKKRPATVHVCYKLPPDLIREVRLEAADRKMWPAQVVTEKLTAAYDRKKSASA